MAKILSFRNKDDTSAGQTYLTDEAEKLSFHTAEDGAVSLDDVSDQTLTMPAVYTDPRKDWTNQELADLFRVRRLLSGANVPVETMRGITDEGDPWFIFCHFNGDVFIHMARIDGTYVLDSPNVRRPLRGADFNGLLADFTGDALPSYGDAAGRGDAETEHRVIRLERGGKIRLHPSAMLAALIWTLFLASEELVMMAPEERAEGSDDLLDFTDIIAADAEFAALETTAPDADGLSAANSFKIDHEETIHTAAPDGHGQMRDVMGQQGLAMQQNTYAMGLSTIAIALGFMSEAVLMDNQSKVLEGLRALGMMQADAHTDTASNPELDQIAGTSSDALMEKLAEFLGLDLSLNTDMAEAATPEEGSLLQQDMLHVNTAAVGTLPPVKTVQTVALENDDADAADTSQELSEALADSDSLILIAAAQQQDDTINMADLVKGSLKMEEFQLGQTTVMASFDVNSSDAFSLSDYLFLDQRASGHRAFDHQAQTFIDYINAKDTDVGIITIGNEIIMIDRAAFLDVSAETYSFSWETDTGQVISMIGLRAEFQAFDLIA
jgi:hypothetical protein